MSEFSLSEACIWALMPWSPRDFNSLFSTWLLPILRNTMMGMTGDRLSTSTFWCLVHRIGITPLAAVSNTAFICCAFNRCGPFVLGFLALVLPGLNPPVPSPKVSMSSLKLEEGPRAVLK